MYMYMYTDVYVCAMKVYRMMEIETNAGVLVVYSSRKLWETNTKRERYNDVEMNPDPASSPKEASAFRLSFQSYLPRSPALTQSKV